MKAVSWRGDDRIERIAAESEERKATEEKCLKK